MLALVAGLGCAPRSNWTRTDARTCEGAGPPVVCFDADPDQPLELHAGDVVLLPGECAIGPRPRGGSLHVRMIDGRGPTFTRAAHVPRGKRNVIIARADARGLSIERERCTVSPLTARPDGE